MIRCSAPPLPSSAAFSQRAGPGGALTGATKPNLAVGLPLPAGERGGLGERVGSMHLGPVLLGLTSRMVRSMQLRQPLTRHVGVDRGGGNIGVAQQQLHGAQIGAVVQ